MRRITAMAVSAIVLSACSSDVSIGKSEIEAQEKLRGTVTYDNAINYGKDLTNIYLAEASNTARYRDGTFLALLAVGTFAGYRAVDGASTTELARTALFGAAGNQAASYYKPGDKTAKLVQAAQRTACVVGHGAAYKASLDNSPYEAPAATLMVATLDKIRTNLRAELANQLPDYATIANAIEAAAKQAAQPSAGIEAAGVNRANEFKDFKLAVEKCPAA